MKPIFNGSVELPDPSSFDFEGQAFLNRVEEVKSQLFETFLASLPSNYVSKTLGPNYTLQYEVVLDQIARYHVILESFNEQYFYDTMSPETMLSELGRAVFPDLSREPLTVNGDVTYREFLKKMLRLLLQGSKIEVLREGVSLLTEAQIDVIEGYLKNPVSGEQFNLILEVHKGDYSEFPENPVATQNNVGVIIKALKPAHVIYEYRHVFKEILEGVISSEEDSYVLESYHYEDARHNFQAYREIVGTSGWFVQGNVFRATTSDLINVEPNISRLSVDGKEYLITEAFSFIDDSTPRAYSTSISGLEGTGVFEGGVFTDSSADFKVLQEGETLEIKEGPNLGVYEIHVIVANGVLGRHDSNKAGSYPSLKVEPLFLRLREQATGVVFGERHDYEVILNPNGRAQTYNQIEDVVESFANDTIRTTLTPIVSRQGDSALAKPKDITVLVDGEEVEVIRVSPLEGKITIALSEPLLEDSTVVVDYYFTRKASQRYQMITLNSGGYNLNQERSLNKGFRAPVQKRVAHRYLGFEGLYSNTLGDLTLNSGSKLNQFNVISSGEYIGDITPESVTLRSTAKEYLSLYDADMRAERIYRVLVDGVSQSFVFEKETQRIYVPSFTGSDYEAVVYFPPAKPITQTYLKSQPLESSPHLLAEGTPPFEIVSSKGGVKTQISSEGESNVLAIVDDEGSASVFNLDFSFEEESKQIRPLSAPANGGLFILGGGVTTNYSTLRSEFEKSPVLGPVKRLAEKPFSMITLRAVMTNQAGDEALLTEEDALNLSEDSAFGELVQLGSYPRLNTFNELNLNFILQGGSPLEGDVTTPLSL